MGLYDRDYTQSDYETGHGYEPRVKLRLPKPSTVVGWLLTINVSVYLIDVVLFQADGNAAAGGLTPLERWFAVYPYSVWGYVQIWRLITYQFLHGGLFHILINML